MENDKLDLRKISDEQLFDIIKDEARKLDIVPYPIPDVLAKVREYYGNWVKYLNFIRKFKRENYLQVCISWALDEVKTEKPIENQMYYELGRFANRAGISADEKKRVEDIVSMLSTEGIFPKNEKIFYTLNEVMQWLDPDQRQALADAILALKDYCDAEGVRSALESADINVSKKKILLEDPVESKLSENAKIYQPAAFVRRLELMTRYIRETANKNFSGTETLGARYWLRSTGSDPHCEGRHALFLVNKSTDEIDYVYKPHDLSADNAVVGEDGMLAVINELLPVDKIFAIVHIDPENHLEDFVIKKSKMTQKEAENYFYKAGMLQVVTDAMAVTDLHQDNIMPTENGPLIIDAEANFFRANFSGLLSALTWPDSNEDPKNASFLIDEGEGETVRSWKVFQNEKSTYRAMYEAGKSFMLGVLEKNKVYLLEKFDKQLHRVIKSRILPMSTQLFSDHLQRSMKLNRRLTYKYISSLKIRNIVDEKSDIGELSSVIINDIIEKFADTEECYIFTEKVGVYLDGNEFVQSIMETFENGTIIAMYIDMDGNIYLDDKKIGYLYDLGVETVESIESSNPDTKIVTHITVDGNIYIYDEKQLELRDLGYKSDERAEFPRQLSREQVIGMIKDHFVEKLKAMKFQMEVE